MARMELSDLTTLLRECGGEDETARLDGDVLDLTFTDLGYDSVAVLETTSRIERDYGLALDEEAISEADTPRKYLALVNGTLTAAPGAA
ncbi:acyl carrier protein [Streptomyces sp. NPDC047097]|uniref:acyl carrier protein n=1 Tax=Streptomyces sp. NPDC047097 TaxID=3155260 RepID=UPI0033DF7F3A